MRLRPSAAATMSIAASSASGWLWRASIDSACAFDSVS